MASPGTLANLVAPGEDAVPRRFEDIERKLKELAPSVLESIRPMLDDIAAAAADASAAAAAASAAVAGLAVLVAQQLGAPDALNTSATPTLTTTPTAYATVTFTVPAGYTKAVVSASTAIAIGSTFPVQIATRIAGADGSYMNVYPDSFGFANGSSDYARPAFTVTPGGTFTVQTIAYTSSGTATSLITTTAAVSYLR